MSKFTDSVRFDATDEDRQIIRLIASRAAKLFDFPDDYERTRNLAMTITATHCNGCPLRLKDLLAASDEALDFQIGLLEDLIDTNTGKLDGGVVPACAVGGQGGAAC